MRRQVMLTAVVILTIALTNWYGDIEAEASHFWMINNQVQVEERPYTTPQDVAEGSGPSVRLKVNKLLRPSLREMQRYCDGQCFYAPGDCKNTEYGCSLIASVSMHPVDEKGMLYCDYFGNDSLRETFCYKSKTQMEYRNKSGKADGPPDRFYTVTLHRPFGKKKGGAKEAEGGENKHDDDKDKGGLPSSCPKRWNDKIGRRCRRTEFVAISFLKDSAPDDKLHKDDLWYVCTLDEGRRTRVSMWTQIEEGDATPRQIIGTMPHLESGMGVVFSRVVDDEEIASMGCQFVIQESNMTLQKPPENAAFFSDKSTPIKVKLASGYVERDENNGDNIRRPFFKDSKSTSTEDPYEVYKSSDIRPTDKLDFTNLEVKLVDASADFETESKHENISAMAMQDLTNKCEHPQNYSKLLIACYSPITEQNCIHTGRCPVMLVVEVNNTDESFKTIRAHLYSSLPDSKSLRKARRPLGFASVGFSKDDQMGRDVVITCHADGRANINVFVSINYFHTNIYPGKVSYNNLIQDPKVYGTANRPRILCSWTMKTSFVVNMFEYEPDYRDCIHPGESEKLAFDFVNEDVHLLLAAGNRNYPGGKINYHDFAQSLRQLFSKQLFFRKTKGDGKHGHH